MSCTFGNGDNWCLSQICGGCASHEYYAIRDAVKPIADERDQWKEKALNFAMHAAAEKARANAFYNMLTEEQRAQSYVQLANRNMDTSNPDVLRRIESEARQAAANSARNTAIPLAEHLGAGTILPLQES